MNLMFCLSYGFAFLKVRDRNIKISVLNKVEIVFILVVFVLEKFHTFVFFLCLLCRCDVTMCYYNLLWSLECKLPKLGKHIYEIIIATSLLLQALHEEQSVVVQILVNKASVYFQAEGW